MAQASYQAIADSVARLNGWIDTYGWEGYDPYDMLNSPLISMATRRSRYLRIGFTQFGKRSPAKRNSEIAFSAGQSRKYTLGISEKCSKEMEAFLVEEGFLVERSEQPDAHSLYIEG